MTPQRLLERIGESIAKRTGGTEICSVPDLREIRQDFQDIYVDAMAEAPCIHPPSQVWNGRCFSCGREATK